MNKNKSNKKILKVENNMNLIQQGNPSLKYTTIILSIIMVVSVVSICPISIANAEVRADNFSSSLSTSIETQPGAFGPNSANEFNNLGLQMLKSGNYQQDSDYFKSALNIDPNNYTLLNNEGLALSLMGNNTEALTYYNKALENNPDDIFAITNKADSFFILGNYHDALAYYNKALAINSKDQHALEGKDNTLNIFNNQ